MPYWEIARQGLEHLTPPWYHGELTDHASDGPGGWKPYGKPRPIAPPPVEWVRDSEEVARQRVGCTAGYIVSGAGTVITSHNPERLERAQGFHFVEEGKSTDMLATAGIFPTRVPPATEKRELPPEREKCPAELREWADGRHWHDLFRPVYLPRVRSALETFQKDNKRDHEGLLAAATHEARGSGAGGHRMRQAAGKRGGEVRVDYGAYRIETQKIIELGFIFEVDEHGRVKVEGERELEDHEFSFNRNELREYLRVLSLSDPWPDASLDDILLRGADDDTDGLPPVIVMSANHQGSRKAPGEFARQVEDEQKAGFMAESRDHPPFIPFTIVAGNLVPKDSADGELRFRKRAEPLSVLALGTPYKVVMRNWDLKNWFRQIPQAVMDRRKNTVMVAGRYVRDDRLVMGKTTASHQGDRLSALIVDFVEHRFDAVFGDWLKGQDSALVDLVQKWDEGRVQVFGDMPEQRRPANWSSFQDDIIAICFSEQLGEFVTSLTEQVIEAELGVTLSVKPAATIPFADQAEAIGCRLHLNGEDRHMEPRMETQDKFRAMAQKAIALGPGYHQVDADWLISLVGLYGHVCRFLPKGNTLRNSSSMLLRPSRNAPKDIRFLNGDMQFIQDLRTVLGMLDRAEFLPLVANARALHGGMLSCAADACMENEGMDGGWGYVIGQSKYDFGLWPEKIVDAWKSGKISISPLEYLVALFAHRKWVQGLLAGPQRGRVHGRVTISRSDNLAACLVSRRLLSSRPTMAYFARRQAEIEAELGVRILFDHIAGEKNRVPDLLSRGQELEAKAEMVRMSGHRCVPTKLVDLGADWAEEVERFERMLGTLQEADGEWRPEDARMAEGEYLGVEAADVEVDLEALRGLPSGLEEADTAGGGARAGPTGRGYPYAPPGEHEDRARG